MSVLIMGMEMPKDCGHRRFAVDGWCYAYGKPNIAALANNVKTNFCPLVPLQEKHGRLIDVSNLENMRFSSGMHGDDGLLYVPFVEVAKAIFNAPTIIEAEGGEEE